MFFAVEISATDLSTVEASVLAAEAAGAVFATFPDSPSGPGIEAGVLASWLARRTTRIGLAPVLHTTTTEPFHLATQLASLDHASLGRAGWVVGATTSTVDLATVGRDAVPAEELGDVVDVARRLWDSWEDDAIVKDVATGRFLDPRKVHHVDFEGASGFSIVGPLITTRPPQGQVVVIGADTLGITQHLDIALVPFSGAASRAAQARAAGAPLVFADVPPGAAFDTLDGVVDGVLLHEAVPPSGGRAGTLREVLGLPKPANRYASGGVR